MPLINKVTMSPSTKVPVTWPVKVMLPVFSELRMTLSPVTGSMVKAVLVSATTALREAITAMLNSSLVVAPRASVAMTLTEYRPTAGGVPLKVRVAASKVSQLGSAVPSAMVAV